MVDWRVKKKVSLLTRFLFRTVITALQRLRDICSLKILHSNVKLGGRGKTVEIDEYMFGHKCKYNCRRINQRTWVFGMVERGTGQALALRVPNRTRQTLVAGLLQQFVKPGTTIISDKFSLYFNLNSPGYIHIMVEAEENNSSWRRTIFFRGGFQTQVVEKDFQFLKGFKSIIVRGLNATKIIDVIHALVMINEIERCAIALVWHLLYFRNYVVICTKSQTIMQKYVDLHQWAFNCAKCSLYKDICTIANIQWSFKTFINVLRNSNSSKQLSFARIVNSITSKEYSFP